MTNFSKEDRNRVVRKPERGQYDKSVIYPIIDEALICHVAFVVDGQPYVIPTLHARDGDDLLLHGASTSRLIEHAGAGNPLCVAITHMDALVLARSIFNHSVNYRSAVLFGRGQLVESPEEKNRALEAFTERLMPGRWYDAREPNAQELKATGVVRMPIDLASAKVRTGSPKDDAEDMGLAVWAGLVPVRTTYGQPIGAPDLQPGTPVPAYLREFLTQRNG
ncbi:MAG: pyridoxamine 5'-phosphate oxidase family protein [Chloroflexi bacterium]|nr:pyridoxamine 5'-phosphate oxidase family protein [Chloroflexota bacterium]